MIMNSLIPTRILIQVQYIEKTGSKGSSGGYTIKKLWESGQEGVRWKVREQNGIE